MDATITSYFITQGPWAVLFVCAFIWMRKDTLNRENRLYQTIEDQNKVLDKFAKKYDVIIEKIEHLENKLGG